MTHSTLPDDREIAALSASLETRSPEHILAWAAYRFTDRLIICTSFQLDGVALIDMSARLNTPIRVVTVDTGRLHDETYALIDQIRERYRLDIEVLYPDALELEPFVRREGINAFYRSVELRFQCCAIRKVNPLARVLSDVDAWITGLRRDPQTVGSATRVIEIDHRHHGVLKISPLASWTPDQVREYVRSHNVPYNRLYDAGYSSIGCAPCTRASLAGEGRRDGRWWWEENAPKECGIHLAPSSNPAVAAE